MGCNCPGHNIFKKSNSVLHCCSYGIFSVKLTLVRHGKVKGGFWGDFSPLKSNHTLELARIFRPGLTSIGCSHLSKLTLTAQLNSAISFWYTKVHKLQPPPFQIDIYEIDYYYTLWLFTILIAKLVKAILNLFYLAKKIKYLNSEILSTLKMTLDSKANAYKKQL